MKRGTLVKNSVTDFIKNNIYIVLGVLCVVVIGIIYIATSGQTGRSVIDAADTIYNPTVLAQQYEPAATEAPAVEPPPIHPDEPIAIIVHIVGEVNHPGVFQLTDGDRVYDALQMAGGATAYADLARINLASFLRDAMQIIVPAIGDDIYDVFIYADAAETPAANAPAQIGGLVNINTAALAELQTLPGVGPILAGNIIEFRETHGSFSSVEELINVSRIGPATLDRLRDLVTIGQ